MKKILVPIDFSLAAKAGFDAALHFNDFTETEIFALNIYQKEANNYSPDVDLLIQQEVEKKHATALAKFTGNYPNLSTAGNQIKPKIHVNISCGNTVSVIIAFSEKNDMDLIVIGTKAKHNLWEYIFGSVSTNLIKRSKIPVLIIPEGYEMKSFKRLLLPMIL